MNNLTKYYIPVAKTSKPSDPTALMQTRSPLPLETIPNTMGINLCSVDRIEWTKRPDGQLVDLTVFFIPDESPIRGLIL